MLAVALGGTQAERTIVGERLAGGEPNMPFDLPQASARLRAGLDAALAQGRFTNAEAATAARRAAMFSV
jgi:hypothetical protein